MLPRIALCFCLFCLCLCFASVASVALVDSGVYSDSSPVALSADFGLLAVSDSGGSRCSGAVVSPVASASGPIYAVFDAGGRRCSGAVVAVDPAYNAEYPAMSTAYTRWERRRI